jgi:hypothetical protein
VRTLVGRVAVRPYVRTLVGRVAVRPYVRCGRSFAEVAVRPFLPDVRVGEHSESPDAVAWAA